MAIPESQLETWSHQGSVTQSAATYETIRRLLNDSGSPYYPKDFTILLQGSYGNDTNVFRDSDVDVVIRLNQTYYADTGSLTEAAKATYAREFNRAPYQLSDFKADVLAWLAQHYGSDVKGGKKAISIRGNNNRRDADVLVCAVHRRYREGSNGVDQNYDEGIIFWTTDGTEIVNFPDQHSKNCSMKHQNTSQPFKRVVRVYKNMRNGMIDDGYIANGVAPSYFIEGMLWNVPNSNYNVGYGDSFVNTFNWILQADRTQLSCANDLHWLVRDNTPVCWPSANFQTYLTAAEKYWRDWA